MPARYDHLAARVPDKVGNRHGDERGLGQARRDVPGHFGVDIAG